MATIHPTPTELAAIGGRIATDGIDTCTAELALVAAWARRAGVPGAVVDVLVDPAEPEVARHRAFARIAVLAGTTAPAAEPAEPATAPTLAFAFAS